MIKLIASDGYILVHDGLYADKVCLGKNALQEDWDEVELTDELFAEYKNVYRDYTEGKEYTEGEHVKDGMTLLKYSTEGITEIRTFNEVETEADPETEE